MMRLEFCSRTIFQLEEGSDTFVDKAPDKTRPADLVDSIQKEAMVGPQQVSELTNGRMR